MGAGDFVISADEKTSIQARRRKQPTLPPAPNRPTKVEHEYFREGASTYLAAWDVHRAKVFGGCEVKNEMAPVERLVSEVMNQEPYRSARRVSGLWTTAPLIVARNLSTASAPNGPTRSSFTLRSTPGGSIKPRSISQLSRGRSLPPMDFSSLAELEQRLLAFQSHDERTATPFKWTFTRNDLHALLAKIAAKRLAPAA